MSLGFWGESNELQLRSLWLCDKIHCMCRPFIAVQPVSACLTNEEKRNAIKNCTETQKGIDLIIGHGNQTQSHINPMYFVPSVEIDDVSDGRW